MSKLRVNSFSVSLDGFAAGPGQDIDNPMGRGAMPLHDWVFPTRTFRQMHGRGGGNTGGTTGIDDDFVRSGFDNLGAWIIGRNMFGPVRGPWTEPLWTGWWGDEPPYHVPVFVLTHHPREDLVMQGGTTFHFVTGGLDEALARSTKAAAGRDIRLGGGVATVRSCLSRRLIDRMHLAIAPVVLGKGENLWQGLDLAALGYRVSRTEATGKVTHVVIEPAAAGGQGV